MPVIFDYLDCGEWSRHPGGEHPEQVYLRTANAALGVSALAMRRIEAAGLPGLLLTNGADIGRMQRADGRAVRERHQLGDAPVVSLIGLTYSRRSLYFLDAVQRAKQREPRLTCLLVGDSPRLRRAVAARADDVFVWVGPVPYAEVDAYFAASDVGLYPVDETDYFHGASPIKVFEYTAAGKPVVLPRLEGVERLGFPNLYFAPPTAAAFADALVAALANPVPSVPTIEHYDWRVLADRLAHFLDEVVHRSAGTCALRRTSSAPSDARGVDAFRP